MNATTRSCLFLILLLPWRGNAETQLERYFAHARVEDPHGVIAPWYQGLNGQCDWRVRIAAETMKRFPWTGTKALVDLPEYMVNGQWRIADNGTITAPDPVRPGVVAGRVDADYGYRFHYTVMAWVAYYRYTGDPAALAHLRMQCDHCLDFTLTPTDHQPWPRFPISVPFKGDAFGHADTNWIQLDISAHQGLALARAYQLVGEPRWWEAVKHWGDLFAQNCDFDLAHRPWNRYGTVLPYIDDRGFGIPVRPGNPNHLTGSTAMIVEFLDELIRLGYTGNNGVIVQARNRGLAYLRETLLPAWTARDAWGRFFWDGEGLWQHIGPTDAAARVFMAHPDYFAHWWTDARNVMSLYLNNATVVNGDTYSGAWSYPESSVCCDDSLDYSPIEMAAAFAELGVRAKDEWARELARRQVLLGTYHGEENGIVRDRISGGQLVANEWFKIVHPMPLYLVLQTIGWLPETLGASRENHLVRSSSVVNSVHYGVGELAYTTFDAPSNSVDVLRLAFVPTHLTADRNPLLLRSNLNAIGYTVQRLNNGDCIVSIRHDGARSIQVTGNDPQEVVDDKSLSWGGEWETDASSPATNDFQGTLHRSGSPGASMTCRFTGNQVRLIGRVAPDGGQADVFLDGEKQLVGVDAWYRQALYQQVIYYMNGLTNGPHELKIVVRGTRNSRSQGAWVYVDAVQFSAATGSSGFGSGGGPTEAQRWVFGYPQREFIDSAGHHWLPATEWVTRGEWGWLKDTAKEHWWQVPVTEPITGTPDPELYRYGAHAAEFWANFTLGPGTYHLRLKFAERRAANDDPFLRAVTVLINDQLVAEDLDIAAMAGGVHRAVDLVFNGIKPLRGIIEVRLRNAYGGEAALQALEVGPGDGGTGASPMHVTAGVVPWKFSEPESVRSLAPAAGGRGLRYTGNRPGNVGDLKLNAPATVLMWLWPRSLKGDQRLLGQLSGPIQQAGALRLNDAALEVWDGQHWQVLVPSGIQAGQWQHLAITFRADGTAAARLNGKPHPVIRSGFDYRGVPAGLAAPFLGAHGKRLSGFLDDVRILPHALTEQEIELIRKEGDDRKP